VRLPGLAVTAGYTQEKRPPDIDPADVSVAARYLFGGVFPVCQWGALARGSVLQPGFCLTCGSPFCTAYAVSGTCCLGGRCRLGGSVACAAPLPVRR